ncbi:MAG: hypothetical protein AAB573_04285 [Patescibacteria group bacterium]
MDPLIIHLSILTLTVLVILYTDHMAFQYVRGTRETIDVKLATRLHMTVWVGLIGMIATGLWMAYPALSMLITMSLFQLKMGFVALLVCNAIFIGTLIPVSVTPYAQLSNRQKTPLMIGGALSTIGWIGAITCAFLFFG